MVETETCLPNALLLPLVRMYVQRRLHCQQIMMHEPVVARLGAILEFQFANPYEIEICATQRSELCPRVVIVGPITYRRCHLVMRSPIETLAVLFRPCGLPALFSLPLSQIAEIGLDAHSVLGRQISALNEELGNANTFGDRVGILDNFFLKLLACRQSLYRPNHALNKLIQGSVGSIDDAAKLSGLSSRQLERQSLELMGVSPKMLMRVSRFQRALNRKAQGLSWTDVAHSIGYYDQAHLIRDFREFAGAAPKQAWADIGVDDLNTLIRRPDEPGQTQHR